MQVFLAQDQTQIYGWRCALYGMRQAWPNAIGDLQLGGLAAELLTTKRTPWNLVAE